MSAGWRIPPCHTAINLRATAYIQRLATWSHSRPLVSNDNPYSEAHFKTLNYRPGYPSYFGSLADARGWAQAFFQWYYQEHNHSGLGLLRQQ